MGQLIATNLPCNSSSCESSDALRVYLQDDGSHNATCFSCKGFDIDPYNKLETPALIKMPNGSLIPKKDESVDTPTMRSTPRHPLRQPTTQEDTVNECLSFPVRALPERSITRETCDHFGVRVALSPTDGQTVTSHFYPRYRNGKLQAFKERIVESKKFFIRGPARDSQLWGEHACKPNGKKLFITEGECDAMAVWQTLKLHSSIDWNPAVVSLLNGAASAAKDISENFDFVNSFDEIILCFDQDDPGQAAVDDVCPLLAGKVYIAKFAEKDPNAMVLAGKSHELYWDLMKHARAYMPDNIINYGECWDRFKHAKNKTCYSYPESWTELNTKTYGVRLGSLVTITSGSGMGGQLFSPFMW